MAPMACGRLGDQRRIDADLGGRILTTGEAGGQGRWSAQGAMAAVSPPADSAVAALALGAACTGAAIAGSASRSSTAIAGAGALGRLVKVTVSSSAVWWRGVASRGGALPVR